MSNAAVDPELRLAVPAEDVASPELSIVVPALNEELTIGEFVDWCKEGLRKAKVVGEVLIVDSSTDSTAEIALSKGARVLKTPKRGLGRAYIDSLEFIRGKYVLMGDCDCTYDFRELGPFVAKFREGVEFIMGSRFRGYIEPGSMPPLHRYLGTPVTTWILNVLFSSHFSDIHCGMRGITRSALERMGLRSQSWEYASEMVLKSVHMKLKTDQVPIRFLKDREGRLSHLKRSGWFGPWSALHWMLLGVTLVTLGLQCIYLGILTQVFFDYTGDATKRWFNRFRYTRTVIASAALFATGLALTGSLLVYYVKHHFLLTEDVAVNYLGVTGLLLMITGFMTFTFTLLLHSTAVVVWRR